MNAYQIILVCISILFLSSGFSKFLRRERNQTIFKFLITSGIWGGILVLSISPGASHALSASLGLGENLNTLIFIGFVIVFIILFRLLSIIEKIEQTISEIIRKEALQKLTTKK